MLYRVLPALLRGCVVVSEDVPLAREVPYADSIVFAPYERLVATAARVGREYASTDVNEFTLSLTNYPQHIGIAVISVASTAIGSAGAGAAAAAARVELVTAGGSSSLSSARSRSTQPSHTRFGVGEP